ncbi:MAG: NAD-dependent epimerase/dehydratase family protein [Gemmatimonadota bacterium]
MKILALGGTLFLGRHTVRRALERGHEVTLFNRGRTGRDLFPECERLVGDRAGDLGALRGRRWDAVLDLSAFGSPGLVRRSAETLRDAADRYVFISSLGVYEPAPGPVHEGCAVRRPAGAVPAVPDSYESYGALMALAEDAVEESFPGRGLVARAGILVGPYDPVDRFVWWLARMERGGEVLAPGRPERRVEFLDARDAAEWLVKCLEAGTAGTFNLAGPTAGGVPMGAWLEGCAAAAGKGARLAWLDDAFLLEHGVAPWRDFPLWEPEGEAGTPGAFHTSVDRAVAAGLAFRPLAATLRDTLEWHRSRPAEEREQREGITLERERELLDARHRAE